MTVIPKNTEVRGTSPGGGGDAAEPARGVSDRLTTIETKRGLADLGIGELWAYRDLLYTLAQRDIKLRYRQTALGAIWVVAQPIMASLIFTIVFGLVGKGRFGSDGLPPFIFIFAGQMAWSTINSTVSRTTSSLLSNTGLVSKIYFPRLVLPLSSIGSIFIDFSVSLVVLIVFMCIYHIPPTPAVVLFPFFLGLCALASSGIGLIMAAASVSYRDVGYILPFIMQLLMYASPVNYSTTELPAAVPHFVRTFFAVNPVTPLVNGMRWTLLGTPAPSLVSIIVITFVSFGLFFGGAFLFRTMEKRFADVI